MFGMFGRVCDTLQYRIQKNLRESVYVNSEYKELRWNLIEKAIVSSTAHPARFVIFVASAWFLGVLLLCLLQPLPVERGLRWSDSWMTIIDWQEAVFAGQLTMIGLIFPLVVGFVGFLLQSRTANRALWLIYSRYSGFMLSGFSGLALVGLIAVSQFARPWISDRAEMAIVIGFVIWFLLNVVLAAWLLRATFLMILEEHRSRLVLRFSVVEGFVRDIRLRLATCIPPSSLGAKEGELNGPKVRSFDLGPENGYEYWRTFKHKQFVRDVRFCLVRAAVCRWKSQARMRPDAQYCMLTLPSLGYEDSRSKWLVASSNKFNLDWITRFLLCFGYQFGRKPRVAGAPVDTYINALVGYSEDALVANNIKVFKQSVDELLAWHTKIWNAMSFTNDKGQSDNWLQFSKGVYFSKITCLEILSHEYFSLGRRAVRRINESTQFFEIYCYFFVRIYEATSEHLTEKGMSLLIENHSLLWSSLLEWKGAVGEPASGVAQNFEIATLFYVGSWERWAVVFPCFDGSWVRASALIKGPLLHLHFTAQLVVYAVRRSDWGAAEWATDMLVNWHSRFSGPKSYAYILQSEMINSSLIGRDTDSVEWTQILQGQGFNDRAAVWHAIQNAWIDVRILTAAYLKSLSLDGDSEQVEVLVSSLVRQIRLKPTGSIRNANAEIRNGGEILSAYIRHRCCRGCDESHYGFWLNSLVKAFTRGRIEERQTVPGRGYSIRGAESVPDLQRSYVELAVGLSGAWDVSDQLLDFLRSPALTVNTRKSVVRDLEDWLDILNQIGAGSPEQVQNAITSVTQLRDSLSEANFEEIVSAEIDETKISMIEQAASRSAFQRETNPIPITFFTDVSYSETPDEAGLEQISISDFSRSRLARGVEDGFADDYEQLERLMEGIVNARIYRDIFRKINADEIEYASIEGLFGQIAHRSREMIEGGQVPLLLIGPDEVRRHLDDIAGGYAEDPSLSVRKQNGLPSEYMCHVNDIEVYRVPGSIDFCVLIPRDAMQALRFRCLGEGRFVEGSFEEGEEEADRTKGSLILRYWLDVTVTESQAFKFKGRR